MLLFAHDHVIYKKEQEYYSNGSFSAKVLERYVKVFGEVRFLSRQEVLRGDSASLTKATHQNVEFRSVPNIRNIKNILKSNLFLEKIKENVKAADYVIARLPSTVGETAIYYAKKYNKPYLIEVVGCTWDSNINHGSLSGKLLAPFEYLINRFLIKKSPYVIYITKSFLQRRYPTLGKTSVCPNVNLESTEEVVLSTRKNKIHSYSNVDTYKIGLIGSLDVDYKGHNTLIEAVSRLKNKVPNIEIEFLGKGDSLRWERIIDDYEITDAVTFKGTLSSGPEVYKWIDSMDLMVQPSLSEAQGRSIIEAMSRACPIIASKVGGIGELIDSNWLIKPKDSKKLAYLIEQMYLSKESQLNQAKRNYDESKFYISSIIENRRTKFLNDFKEGNT